MAYCILMALAAPGNDCLYAALTRRSAKKIAWRLIKKFNKDYELGMAFNETELTAILPNGSEIQLMGINDIDAAESLRGQHFALIVLDESASYGPHFEYIIDEILVPCLIDLDGTLAMIGTPSAACQGPFYNATAGIKREVENEDGQIEEVEEFSVHKWGILNNPHIPHAARWLDSYRKRKGWSKENPKYLREWCGVWVRSENDLVYKYEEPRNLGRLPEGAGRDWNYIIGVDLGYDDATAFVVLAYSATTPDLYVVDTFKRTKMLPSDVALTLDRYNSLYAPVAIVADTGGLGKALVEEMKARYAKWPLKAAEKQKKFEYIELLNSDLFEGHVKIDPDLEDLRGEIKMLQYDPNRRKDKRAEDPRFENHLCDAFLYAWRESNHWGYQEPEPVIKEGSDEWAKQHERELAEKMRQDEETPWYDKLLRRCSLPLFAFAS